MLTKCLDAAGDGGIAMLLGELLTLHQQKLPVKMVVNRNGALSFVELEMEAAGIVTYGTDLVDPDFAGIARAAGLLGAPSGKGRRSGGSAEHRVRPGRPGFGRRGHRPERAVTTAQAHGQIKGFSRYAPRTVLSGEGSELIELTKTNLRELAAELT
jgi:pyruvate dehydrogenase (quinone)